MAGKPEAGVLNGEHRLIAAGFGGQGILTLGKAVCMAAMRDDLTVTYLPSYGSEVRGGTAKCEVVVRRETICSPLVDEADSLVILNQPSFEKFVGRLKPGGLLVANTSIVEDATAPNARVLAFPASDIAIEMGNMRVANVIMLGAFIRATGLLGEQSCRDALEDLLGERKADLLGLNLRAFARGMELAESS